MRRQGPSATLSATVAATLKAEYAAGKLTLTVNGIADRAAEIARLAGSPWKPSKEWVGDFKTRDLGIPKRVYG